MRNLLFVFIFLASGFISMSQEVTITDVKKRHFRGVNPIMNNQSDECIGYYTYFFDEKVAKGEFKFNFMIFDIDLKLIKKAPIILTKRSKFVGSSYNGEDFMFVFRDVMKKLTIYMTFDSKGEKIKEISVPDSKRYLSSASVYAAEDGFFIVKPIKEKKHGYAVLKYDRDLNQKWERKFMPQKGYASVEAVETGGDRIIIIQVVGKSVMSRNMIGEVLCLNNSDGEMLYNYPLYDGVATCIPSSFLIDKDKNVITGGMYFDGEKWDAKNSDGIFFLKLSPTGEKIAYQKENWDEGIQAIIKENSEVRFAIGTKPKVLFEDIIQNDDGSYQIISETFRKSWQVVNIKVKDLITGRYIGDLGGHNRKQHGSAMNFEILDFIVFSYDDQGKLADMNFIEKPHTNITCYTPYNGYRSLSLAKAVEEMGWFNYGFMNFEEGSDRQIMVSKNFVIGDPYIGLTTIDKGKISETVKISIDKKSSKGGSLGVSKSKPGKIFTYLYDRKEMTIFMKILDMTI